ncbi:MAG: histidinol-phosphatase HisJ family protein [Ruminococcaceae bacterium]|nr:histidinol-phosphatase HisJ family protein [Oscillospiraceae bacterium]
MLVDHHTHCRDFSFDGRQPASELISAARTAGLALVCLTDHYEKDMSYIAGEEAIFDLDAYDRQIRIWQQQALDAGLQLLYGIELGYLPHLDNHYARLTRRYAYDAVILSLHISDGEDPYSDTYIYNHPRDQVYGRYLEQLAEMIEACPDFDILGHADYISRYATWPDRKIYWREQPDRFDTLFRTLIRHGKTLELNTATVRALRQAGYNDTESWPDRAIFQRYRELGGEQVCLSSDAHTARQVGYLLKDGQAYLSSLGFTHLTHYIGRKAQKITIGL